MAESVFTPESAGGQHLGAEPRDSIEIREQFTDLVSVAGKGDRISMSTLCFDPYEAVSARLAFKLIEACGRGAEVQLAIDHFGYLLAHQIGMVATGRLIDPKGLEARKEVEDALRMAGANVTITNRAKLPFTPLFRVYGRNHIKASAITTRDYEWGSAHGHNEFGTKRLDNGVVLRDPAAVKMLHDTVTSLVQTGTTKAAFQGKDQPLRLPHGELLRDSGKPGQSIILNTALAMIDNAKESITMTTQYAPHGALIRHLRAAEKRGVALNIACSHSNVRMQHQLFSWMRTVNGFIYSDSAAGYCIPDELPELHSKNLIVDAGIPGEEEAMTGSSDLSSISAFLGNAELAYRSNRPAFVAKLGEIALKQTTIASA